MSSSTARSLIVAGAWVLLALPVPTASPGAEPLPPGAVRRLAPASGASNPLLCAAYSPDGKLVAVAGEDREVRLFSVSTGGPVRTFRGHQDLILCVAFSPGGKRLASGSADGSLRLWDVATGREIRRVAAHGVEVAAVVFSPDGQFLATGGGDRVVRSWDPNTGRKVREYAGARRPIRCLAVSPDGRLLAAGGWDRTVHLWDVASGKELRQLRGHKSCVLCLAFTADGQSLASGGRDQTLRVWDLWNGRPYFRLAGWNGEIHSVALSPLLPIIASADANQAVRLWDLATGHELKGLKGHAEQVFAVAFSPDGRALVSAGGDGAALVWDVKGLLPARGPLASNFSRHDFDRFWDALATDDDDPDVCLTVRRLLSAGDRAVAYVRSRLPPVSPREADHVAELIRALDDDQFAVREKATEELIDSGRVAVPMLRRELRGHLPSLEVRRRVERVLENLPVEKLERHRDRERRAVEVMERLGSPEAKRVLGEWARGAPDAPLTRDARSALDRLRPP